MRSALALMRREAPMMAGLAVLLAMAALPLLGPLVVDPGLAAIGSVPPRRPPGAAYWLGTDTQGRDVLASLLTAIRGRWRSDCWPG